MFENSVSDPMSTITAVLLGFQWSALLQSIVMRDAMRGVFTVSPELRCRLFVKDAKPFLKRDLRGHAGVNPEAV